MISADRWQALQPFVDELLDLDLPARAARLAAIRDVTPLDADALEALLATGYPTVLTTGAVSETLATLTAAASLAGQRLGAWTLVRPLGSGGMGAVWLAERNDGRFSGVAAVKLLHAGLVDRYAETRFRLEGDLLARLTHPNIARLLDAGVTAHGQPYLVLEHVDGVAIDEWCRARAASVPTILGLLDQLLAAVAHAHARGVVHRDVKPSNLLVTDDGVVKLLDFGIAQWGESTRSAGSAEPFTPRYAAPEQLRGEPVTIATDIYAVGVVAYELLSGRHPTAPNDADRSSLEHAILHAVPTPLPERIARDVDAIVRRAVAHDADARYPTAMAMAEDFARWRRREPVQARNGSRWYRLRRFVSRHRSAVIASVVALLLLLTALASSIWQAIEARRQRDLARLSERRATVMSEVLSSSINSIDRPPGADHDNAMLRRVRSMLVSELADAPTEQARIALELAERYDLSGRTADADSLLALALQASQVGSDSAVELEARCANAGRANQVHGVMDREVRSALARADRLPPSAWRAQVGCRIALSTLLLDARSVGAAYEPAREAVALARAHGDTMSFVFLRALGAVELAAEWTRGRRAEGSARRRQLLVLAAAMGVESSVYALSRLASEIDYLLLEGRVRDADSIARATTARLSVDDRWKDAAPYLLSTCARAFHEAGAEADAFVWFARSVPVGLTGVEGVTMRLAWATALGRSGRTTEAEEQLRAAAQLLPTVTNGALTANFVRARAATERGRGRPDRAARMLDSLLRSRGYPEQRPRLVGATSYLTDLTEALVAAGRPTDALLPGQTVFRALSAKETTSRPSLWWGSHLLVMAQAWAAAGDSASARTAATNGLLSLRGALAPGDVRIAAAEQLAARMNTPTGLRGADRRE